VNSGRRLPMATAITGQREGPELSMGWNNLRRVHRGTEPCATKARRQFATDNGVRLRAGSQPGCRAHVIRLTEIRPIINSIETQNDRSGSQRRKPRQNAQADSKGSSHDAHHTPNPPVYNAETGASSLPKLHARCFSLLGRRLVLSVSR
jgi:hypothetical protein